jgi:SnoaL-like domain
MAGLQAHRRVTLEGLVDRSEIHDLAVRYCRAVDRREWGVLPTLYHSDAHNIYGPGFSGSPEDFVRWLCVQVEKLEATAHYVLNSSYRVDGAYAEGELYFIAYHRTLPPERREIIVAGRYLDRYERREDGPWKIAKRTLVWDWANDSAVSATSLALLGMGAELASFATDASYAALKLFCRDA